jgi:uncharacterized protein YegL
MPLLGIKQQPQQKERFIMSATRIWSEIENSQSRNTNNESYSMVPAIRSTAMVQQTANIMLMDVSGSTKEKISSNDRRSKLTGEKEAVTMFISKLPVNIYFALITFDAPSNLIIPLQQLSEKLSAIRAVQDCISDGGTGMRSALCQAYEQFHNAPSGYQKRCYCVTDGMGTDGSCREIANRLKENGVKLHFIGVGHGNQIDEPLMMELASMSQTEGALYKHFTEFSQLSQYMRTQTQTITN